ncbi:MAG: vanomycin resistance protein VanB [Chloroflexaceae bacterium]|nr:vanomycin resistance protein VanB [Chloroflexaceae bacterium]
MSLLSDTVRDNPTANATVSAPPWEEGAEAPGHPHPERSQAQGRPARKPRSCLVRVLFHLIGWPVVLLIVLALLTEAVILLLLFGEHDYLDRIYPNIRIQGVDLSNHSTHSARNALNQHYATFLDHPVELRFSDQVWYPRAEELGISLNFDQAIQEAAAVGHRDTRVGNFRTIAAVWQQGMERPLTVQVDQRMMQRYLLGVAQAIERRPRNANIALNGTQVIVTPEKDGLQVLVDETLQDITVAVQALNPQPVPVRVRTRMLTPVVHDSDIAPIANELRAMLANPIVLTGPESECGGPCRWEWSPEEIARWVSLARGFTPDGHPTVSIQVDQVAIRNELVPIAKTLRREGTLPRLNWNDGQVQIFQPGLPGRGLDVTLVQSYLNEALAGGPRTLGLPFVQIPPPVNELNLSTLNLQGPVSVGVSSFRHSESYRITNIRAGANRLHGLLIPPGAEFSFNNHLGPVDASGGFVMGSAIVDHRVQQEWGGGLCQVSTTMFRAAFWAGLPVTERHEHDFRIMWYEELGEPPGLDAAIYTGVADLRFINDTGGWILIQTWVDLNRQQLFISFYGSALNRHIEMSHRIIKTLPRPSQSVTVDDPKLPRGTFRQTDWAQPGLVVEVYRDVWENGTLVRRDTFPTTFKAWPNIFVRGTGR